MRTAPFGAARYRLLSKKRKRVKYLRNLLQHFRQSAEGPGGRPMVKMKKPSSAFVAFDFETANAARASACAIGIAVFEKGKVVEKVERLIRPLPNYFDAFNTRIHGITAEDVQEEPEFQELWSFLEPWWRTTPVSIAAFCASR